jgi:hypothetical protein
VATTAATATAALQTVFFKERERARTRKEKVLMVNLRQFHPELRYLYSLAPDSILQYV